MRFSIYSIWFLIGSCLLMGQSDIQPSAVTALVPELDLVKNLEFRIQLGDSCFYGTSGDFLEQRVIQVGLDGKRMNLFSFPAKDPVTGQLEKFGVANFAYMNYHDMVIASVMNYKNGVRRLLLWSSNGDFLGYGIDPSLVSNPYRVYYRNITEVQGRLYANQLRENDGFNTLFLQEIELVPEGDNYVISPVGKPFFFRHARSNTFKDAFKHIFVTKPRDDDQLFVMGQFGAELNVFDSQRPTYDRIGSYQLNLINAMPYEGNESHAIPKWMKLGTRGYHQITRVTGLQAVHDSLMVTYTVPNPRFKWKSVELSGKEAADDNVARSPYLLCGQRVLQNGEISGPIIELEGGLFLGFSDGDQTLNFLAPREGSLAFEIHSYSAESLGFR